MIHSAIYIRQNSCNCNIRDR